jgi:hypothetical protein
MATLTQAHIKTFLNSLTSSSVLLLERQYLFNQSESTALYEHKITGSMPCSQQPASAYQHSHPFIGPYSKTFQSSPQRYTLLIYSTRFNIILNNYAYLWHAVPFRQVPRPKFRMHFSSVMRAPRSDNYLSDLVILIEIMWSCPLRNFLNPRHFHFSNDFPKLPICYCCFALPKFTVYYRTQREAFYAPVPQTAYAVSNPVIQTA